MYSAKSAVDEYSTGKKLVVPTDAKASNEKTIAAIGAVPYAARSDTWLALSNLFFGTIFGTVASFAGDQKSVKHSTRIVAVYNQK